MSQTEERFFFKVPFDDKDDAKALGARFDGTRRLWYAPDAAVKEALAFRWTPVDGPGGGSQRSHSPGRAPYVDRGAPAGDGDKVLFEVPFDDNQVRRHRWLLAAQVQPIACVPLLPYSAGLQYDGCACAGG